MEMEIGTKDHAQEGEEIERPTVKVDGERETRLFCGVDKDTGKGIEMGDVSDVQGAISAVESAGLLLRGNEPSFDVSRLLLVDQRIVSL